MEYMDIKIEGVIIEVIEMKSHYYIDAIIVDENMRCKGLGSSVINHIKELAYSNGKNIVLYACDLLSGNIDKLYIWYKSLGFVLSNGLLNDEYEYNFEYIIK